MLEDREILRQVWEGRVAACISLADQDVNTIGQPDPHYLMLPRISYFTLVLEKARKAFQRFVKQEHGENEVWLDFEGIPLKMQCPIGVLCDLHHSSPHLPWRLTLHFSPLPASLVSLPSRESVESTFVTCLKEADALKHRGTVMAALEKRDYKQLWSGLTNDKFDQFWSINQKLMDTAGFRSVPFKLHFPSSLGETVPAVMRLQRPLQDGQPLLLHHLLHDTLQDVLATDTRVLMQGVEVPLDTPLLWLSQHLSYPDNFLHICVAPTQQLQASMA